MTTSNKSIDNNLDFVRLFAAGMVLYSHSFTLLGLKEPLFLSWIPLGPLGVFVFFIISGYLVSESWERDPNLFRFFHKRLLRIIPALAVCIFVSALVLGPSLTSLKIKDYLLNQHTWGYFQNIALHIVYFLPGVFEHNLYPNAVNGSIWSLPVEFLMYILVAFAGLFFIKRWIFLALALGSAIVCLLWAQVSQEMLVIYNFDLRQMFICGTYFWVGACIQRFRLRSQITSSAGMLAMFVMLALEPWPAILATASWILLPIVVLAFGFAHSPWLSRLTRNGDYSYGFYIYAFPIQQTVVYFWPKIEIVNYLLVCALLTYGCAALSWHLVERKALRFKPIRPA